MQDISVATVEKRGWINARLLSFGKSLTTTAHGYVSLDGNIKEDYFSDFTNSMHIADVKAQLGVLSPPKMEGRLYEGVASMHPLMHSES